MRRVGIGRSGRDRGVVVRRDVHRVGTGSLGDAGHRDAILERRAVGAVLGRVEPAPHREVVTDAGADLAQDLHEDARPVLDRSAVFVGAVVLGRREEPVDQVAVSGVELTTVDAGFSRPHHRGGEIVHDAGDVVVVEHLVVQLRLRADERLDHLGAFVGGDHPVEVVASGRPRLRGHPHRPAGQGVVQAVGPRLRELHGEGGTVTVDPLRGLPPAGDVAVVGDRGLARVRAPDGERHPHRPEHDHGQAPAGAGFEVRHLGIGHHAVEVTEVFAHRCHDHAVAQLQRADPRRRQQMLEPAHVMYSPEFT